MPDPLQRLLERFPRPWQVGECHASMATICCAAGVVTTLRGGGILLGAEPVTLAQSICDLVNE